MGDRRSTRRVALAALLMIMALLTALFGPSAATARRAAAVPVHGGTIKVAFSDDMVTFDPAQAYSEDWTILNGTLFNGLYQFDRHGVPQLDLAAAPPAISADRTVWTFHLRKGVLFSDGTEVTANDLKFSIVRTLDPNLKPGASWGQSTDAIFQGSQDFIAGKSKTVPGIQVLDRYTIRFVLTQPVAILPYILAESFNMVVPQAVVTADAARSPTYFGDHPVGTGPFMLQSWQKGTQVVFVRNPRYFHQGKPYLSKIVVYVNVAPNVIALRVEKGELTGFGTAAQLAAADLHQARGDATDSHYLKNAPIGQVDWLNLNVHVAPLDNQKLREAVAMAIDRTRLVELLGGAAAPANQFYVPLDPQYDPSLDQHPVYAYDPKRAAALVKASGYHGQPITVMYYSNLQDTTGMAPGILQSLQQIGLNVTLRGVGHNSLLTIVSKLTGHQISTAFWGIDFFDGFDVYSGSLSCGAEAAGQAEGAHYCDQTADNLANRAETAALGAARNALLRQAQRRLLGAAAEIPLVYIKAVEMVSPKVGGYYYHPIFAWQFENYWLNP
ncbi:MAG TPA: ABC transporter substrate-binding protein [Chloroflexota bacterium]|nr:ABC transporter substrate-binding protein [Chloroflexota bacterium]